MNHWVIGFVSAGVAVVVLFLVAPGVFLRLALRLFPKDDVRRIEFLADFYCVPRRHRPNWVLGQLLRCACEGASASAYKRDARKIAAERLRALVKEPPVFKLRFDTWEGKEYYFEYKKDSTGRVTPVSTPDGWTLDDFTGPNGLVNEELRKIVEANWPPHD